MQGLGFRVNDLVFRVYELGLELRIQGLGFRV